MRGEGEGVVRGVRGCGSAQMEGLEILDFVYYNSSKNASRTRGGGICVV